MNTHIQAFRTIADKILRLENLRHSNDKQLKKDIFIRVWGDFMGKHLLDKWQHECNYNTRTFIADLDHNNIDLFIKNF